MPVTVAASGPCPCTQQSPGRLTFVKSPLVFCGRKNLRWSGMKSGGQSFRGSAHCLFTGRVFFQELLSPDSPVFELELRACFWMCMHFSHHTWLLGGRLALGKSKCWQRTSNHTQICTDSLSGGWWGTAGGAPVTSHTSGSALSFLLLKW